VDLEQRLRAADHRVTAPRRLVWDVLSSHDGHLTAQEVLDLAQCEDPSFNLSSVYRTLTLFERLDLVRESKVSSDGTARWELIHSDDMIHLVCEGCGAIDHHGGHFVAQLASHLDTAHGFGARAIDVTVFGRCGHCRAAGGDPGGEPAGSS
jgi:Fur family ferric uptake transcriptional regulator